MSLPRPPCGSIPIILHADNALVSFSGPTQTKRRFLVIVIRRSIMEEALFLPNTRSLPRPEPLLDQKCSGSVRTKMLQIRQPCFYPWKHRSRALPGLPRVGTRALGLISGPPNQHSAQQPFAPLCFRVQGRTINIHFSHKDRLPICDVRRLRDRQQDGLPTSAGQRYVHHGLSSRCVVQGENCARA